VSEVCFVPHPRRYSTSPKFGTLVVNAFPGFQIDDNSITRPGEDCRKFACLYVDWVRVYQIPSEGTMENEFVKNTSKEPPRDKHWLETENNGARDLARAEIASME